MLVTHTNWNKPSWWWLMKQQLFHFHWWRNCLDPTLFSWPLPLMGVLLTVVLCGCIAYLFQVFCLFVSLQLWRYWTISVTEIDWAASETEQCIRCKGQFWSSSKYRSVMSVRNQPNPVNCHVRSHMLTRPSVDSWWHLLRGV